MSRTQAILLTLISYKFVLVAIGFWASRRTRNDSDFYLGGRNLGSWIAALSASASSSSAWTLLGVSGAAYAWGISALWIFPSILMGFAINWLWVAPRLMQMSRESQSLTLTEFLAGDRSDPLHGSVIRFASAAIIFSFMFYVASQFQAAGHAFASSFGLSPAASIALGAAIIVLYTLLGGFWAVSLTDSLQGLLMVGAAVFLPIVVFAAVGGPSGLASGLSAVASIDQLSLTGAFGGVLGLSFILGTMGIGLGYPGQPHVVNRFMALRDQPALRRGRIIALAWATMVYSGMLLLGLCARVLWPTSPEGEQIFFVAATETLPPVLAGIMIAAVLSAIMSTADSQLLVASSAISWDWRRVGMQPADEHARSLTGTRITVLTVSAVAMLLAIAAPAEIFSRVLFAWHALGSAFGPVLVLRLAGYHVSTRGTLASMIAGFGLTVLLHFFPDAPGDAAERLIPLLCAFAIAWFARSSGSRRSIPNAPQ